MPFNFCEGFRPYAFGNNFSKRKDQEVSTVAHGRPQQRYPGYQHVAAVMPTTNVVQNPGYQPQFQQYQQQYQQKAPQQCAAQNRF